jgi:hypothetical protein
LFHRPLFRLSSPVHDYRHWLEQLIVVEILRKTQGCKIIWDEFLAAQLTVGLWSRVLSPAQWLRPRPPYAYAQRR